MSDAVEEVRKIGKSLEEARNEMSQHLQKQQEELKQYGETTEKTAKQIQDA